MTRTPLSRKHLLVPIVAGVSYFTHSHGDNEAGAVSRDVEPEAHWGTASRFPLQVSHLRKTLSSLSHTLTRHDRGGNKSEGSALAAVRRDSDVLCARPTRVRILDFSVTKVQTILTGQTISVLSGYLRRIRTCSRLVFQIVCSMWVVQESAEVI